MNWQDRGDASFGQEVWDEIDAVARAAAEEVRAARRVLEVIGPLGFEARAGVAEDERVQPGDDEAEERTHVHVPRARMLPVLHRTFSLGARSVEALEQRGEPLTLTDAAEAARALARAEDRVLFDGHAGAGVIGLLGHPGALELRTGDWADPARAADDLLEALIRLDGAGRHGPYAVALAPVRYYALLRPHPASGLTPYQQLQPAFAGGIVKAPVLSDAAVVVMRSASGPRAVIGQDLAAAYDGREGIFHRISLVESVTLLPGVPGSVAILRAGAR
ncbi:family 1 encapsulin nanocompartment shell protein [Anaeromyxobacter oryzisoli]|uniref:family 1 encapsulin nanocompartment shell protein n=1 Tax=Anaeromyxobacter oryzisoli TaxID=2925408 RepID=UPI001F586CCF|nr:family 1 encapsulin nanocompartment shell protein [Anaeromyxobacter sp. SG63]